jgi:hypothetical protein
MVRLFSCCSSASFTVFVTLVELGSLILGVPGMADEPFLPPGTDQPCYDPNDGPCSNGQMVCGNPEWFPCCECDCGDSDSCCDCIGKDECILGPTCQRTPRSAPAKLAGGLAVACEVSYQLLQAPQSVQLPDVRSMRDLV